MNRIRTNSGSYKYSGLTPLGNCTFECNCPSGFWNGGISPYITRPCNGPAPTMMCVPRPKPKCSWKDLLDAANALAEAWALRGAGIRLPVPVPIFVPIPATP